MPRAKRSKPISTIEHDPTTLLIPSPEELNEPSDNLWDYMLTLYGTKGIGKSTLAASIPDSITLMAEPRRRNLRIRQISLQLHTAKQILEGATDLWQQVIELTPKLIDDPTIEHINFDSIDLIYEACRNSVAASNGVTNPSKAGKESSSVWIEVADEFRAYFDTLAESGMGIIAISHTKEREIEAIDGTSMAMQSPSCAPACLQYLKQASDFAFFYGYYSNQRAICVYDPTNVAWTANGVPGKFQQPNGKPLQVFEMPNDQAKGYKYLEDAFNNKLWDIDTPKEERTTTPRPTKKKPPRK